MSANQNGINLSQNSVSTFFSFSTKLSNDVNNDLQVLQTKVTAGKQNGNIYTATLSDGRFKFERFFLPEKLGGPIKEGDIVRVLNIQKCVSNNKHFFKVFKFVVTGNCSDIIGNPQSFNENDTNSSFIESSEGNNKNNLNGNNNNNKFSTNGYKLNNSGVENNQNHSNNGHTNSISTYIEDNNDAISSNKTGNNCTLVGTEKSEPAELVFVKPTKPFHYKLQQLSTFTKDLSIIVRCNKKTEKRTYKTNKGGNCTVFNFNVIDSENTEMQASCFGKCADRLFPIIQEGFTYEILGGYVKVNDRRYNQTKSDYQLNLNDDTVVHPIRDSGEIIDIAPALTSLDNLDSHKVFDLIDFLCLVIETHGKTPIKTKKGDMTIKKIVVVDDSEYKVDVTLWKHHSEVDIKQGDILLVKKGKVCEYSGKNISLSDEASIIVNPEMKSLTNKVNSLRELKKKIGLGVEQDVIKVVKQPKKNDNDINSVDDENDSVNEKIDKEDIENESMGSQSKSNPIDSGESKKNGNALKKINHNFKTYNSEKIQNAKTLYECKLSTLRDAFNDKNEKVHKVKVLLTQFIPSDKIYYAGCPTCKKKLLEENSVMKCPNCNNIINDPYYYFTASFRVKDCTSDQFVDCFGNIAESIIGVTGLDFRNAIVSNNNDFLKQICKNIEFKEFILKVKVRTQIYNNIEKKKLGIISSEPVEIKDEINRMFKYLEMAY